MPHHSPPVVSPEPALACPSRLQRLLLAAAIFCEAAWIALLAVLAFAQ
jgi:hypothetical protein